MRNAFLARPFVLIALPLCLFVAAGCSRTEDAGQGTGTESGPSQRAGGPTGVAGRGGLEVAADATAAQIFQQKCQNCHGERGEGRVGPALNRLADRPSEQIRTVLLNGRGRMPSFATQLSEAQITALIAHVKQLSAVK